MMPEPEPEVLPGQVWRYSGETWTVGAVRWDGYEHTAYLVKPKGQDTMQLPARLIARDGTLKGPSAQVAEA